MKLTFLKNRDMIINKARLNDFVNESKHKFFTTFIELNLNRKQIDLWERKIIIDNITSYAYLLKELYYDKDDMSIQDYLKEIGWDGFIDIFKNDYDQNGFRKMFVSDRREDE